MLYACLGLSNSELNDENSPELGRLHGVQNRFIVPPKVLAAMAAKGHAPAVPRKPGMGLSGLPYGHCARAGIKGMKIAFNTRRVHVQVSVPTIYVKQSIRITNETTADIALVGL
jgi:hypothetical protein